MLVEMRVQLQGKRNGQRWPLVGETIDLPDLEAESMISAGWAIEAGGGAPQAPEPPPEAPSFDPGDHTVREVREWVSEHPEALGDVLAAELAGKTREGVLSLADADG